MIKNICNHPALQYNQDIADICNPLNKLNISYFAHVRVDHSGNFSALNNNPNFMEHYLKNKYFNADVHMAGYEKFGRYIVWDAIERHGQSDKMHREASQFGVQHTFTIIEKNANGSDYYHFANHENSKEINQIYLSNLDLLKLFIQHFNDNIKKSKALSQAYDFTFKIDQDLGGFNIRTHEKQFLYDKNEFLKSIHINQLTHQTETSNLFSIDSLKLTKREKECLSYFVRGKSAKEIGVILNLSKRTIEHYLAKTKEKMQVTSKGDLIEKVINRFYVASDK